MAEPRAISEAITSGNMFFVFVNASSVSASSCGAWQERHRARQDQTSAPPFSAFRTRLHAAFCTRCLVPEGGASCRKRSGIFHQLAEILEALRTTYHSVCAMSFRSAFSPRASDRASRAYSASRFRGHRVGFQAWEQTLDGGVSRPSQQRCRDANPAGIVFFLQENLSDACPHRRSKQLRQSTAQHFCCAPTLPAYRRFQSVPTLAEPALKFS